VTRYRSTRAEIARLRAALDESFMRESQIDSSWLTHKADYASFLCIRVAGYLEKSVEAILVAHFRERAGGMIRSYGESTLTRPQNLSYERLLQTIGLFDLSLQREFGLFMAVNERKSTLNALISYRNNLAHGESTGISIQRVNESLTVVQEVVVWLLNNFNSS